MTTSDKARPAGQSMDEPRRPRVSREVLEAALREAIASANEVAAKIQGVFELPDEDGGPRFK